WIGVLAEPDEGKTAAQRHAHRLPVRAPPGPSLEDHLVMRAAVLPQFEREFGRNPAARPGGDLDPDALVGAARDLLRLVPHRLGIAAVRSEADRRPVAVVR